jgi:hypothetical protein
MPLPSLYPGQQSERDWRLTRAAVYGACIGVGAALFRMLGPLGERTWAPARFLELGEAAFAFAILCVGAAVLRNALARRFVKDA